MVLAFCFPIWQINLQWYWKRVKFNKTKFKENSLHKQSYIYSHSRLKRMSKKDSLGHWLARLTSAERIYKGFFLEEILIQI